MNISRTERNKYDWTNVHFLHAWPVDLRRDALAGKSLGDCKAPSVSFLVEKTRFTPLAKTSSGNANSIICIHSTSARHGLPLEHIAPRWRFF